MRKSLAWYIGLRYTRSKQRNKFVSFISLASVIGIALGVAVLITVLSVFNGFDEAFQKNIFDYVPQVTLTASSGVVKDWQNMAKTAKTLPAVTGAAPYIAGDGVVNTPFGLKPLQVYGILPQAEKKIAKFAEHMVEGRYDSLKPGAFNMLIGTDLASELGVGVGDKVVLLLPNQMNLSPAGANFRQRRFTISGIYQVNRAIGPYNSQVGFIDLMDAGKLYPAGNGSGGLHLTLQNIYQANQVASELMPMFPDYNVTTWMTTFGAFSQAIGMQKTMMFIILLLIVAIAAFNLVSTLVMGVNEKQADIAILRTLGLRPKTIMNIFIVQGFVLGLIGTLCGLVLGLIMALNVTRFVDWLQGVLHQQLISDNVYILNYLPSKISMHDVLIVTVSALLMSLIATLYPAYKAFKIQPAEALRYE